MKKKLNKKNVALIIILIIMIITLPTFGRYIYNNIRDQYLKSRNFSFSSNLLATSEKTYKYSNWSGLETYEVDFKLYSYENELSLFDYEGAGLNYKLNCYIDDETKATVHIGSTSGGNTGSGYIPDTTNIKDVKIYLVPIEKLKPGEVIKLTVEAETTVPYKKKISAVFEIKTTEELISYRIEDKAENIYATLKLLNADTVSKKLTLTFDPEQVTIDTSDECYINRISQTTKTISEIEYIDSITIVLEEEDSKNIKFYKKDKSENYTYPGGTYENMIISITKSN